MTWLELHRLSEEYVQRVTDWIKKDILSKRVFALKCAEYLKKDASTNALLLDALI